jgi:hypothetical protein
VTRVTGSRSDASNRNGTRSFFAGQSKNEDHTPDNYDNENHERYAEACSAAAAYSRGTTDLFFIQDPAILSEDAICLAASVYVSAYLSAAELALQTATGSAFLPLECWGCRGRPTRHDDRLHRWSSCPHRGDRVAQNNAKMDFKSLLKTGKTDKAPRKWSTAYSK